MGGLGVVGTRVARWTVGRVVPGHICYVTDAELRDRLASGTGRAYLAGGKITSAYLESSWLRLISRWEDTTPEELAATVELCCRRGMRPPSCYADIFHKLYRGAHGAVAANRILASVRRGPWEERWSTPDVVDRAPRYDLNAAYASASRAGLPVGLHPTTDPDRADSLIVGLWGVPHGPRYPRPMHAGEWFGALTSDERRTYRVTPLRVDWGVAWDGITRAPWEILDSLARWLPAHKRVARAYWGGWHSLDAPNELRLTGGEVTASRRLHAIRAHLLWSHTIMTRVHLAMYGPAQSALQVYVDCAWTETPPETGTGPGEFREVFPAPLARPPRSRLYPLDR